MLKKLLCLVLACVCVLTFAACGDKKKDNGKDKNGSSSQLVSGDRVTSGGITTSQVDDSVLNTNLASKKYNGAEFKFYYWYQYGENVDRKISAFNEAHDAKVSTEIGTEFEEDIAKSIVEGVPYDIIANHAQYFPQTVISDLFEPLNEHLGEKLDYFDKKAPKNGGFSKEVIDAFTWNGNQYTAGSALSVYPLVFFYNKKMFGDSGLEDPYNLWKEGKWTWDKCVELSNVVTDVENGTAFFEEIPINNWLIMNGCSLLKVGNMTAAENLGDARVVDALQRWQAMFISDTPMCLPTYADMFGGSAYAAISYTDVYSIFADKALNSSAFDKTSTNLGVVPVPSGLMEDPTMYPGHVPQGYSAAKGAKDTSVVACYALFESRTTDEEVGSTTQMPPEISNYISEAVGMNCYLGSAGWADSTGTSPQKHLNAIGKEIKAGADVASTIAAKRGEITKCIEDTLSRIK